MKGHLHLRMEELLQLVDILGLKVMISMALRQCFSEEIFQVIFHMEKKFLNSTVLREIFLSTDPFFMA